VIKRILIDSNVYTAFRVGHTGVVGLLRRVEAIALNAVVLAELLAGFRGGSREEENRVRLSEFLASPRVITISIDEDTAEFYAALYSGLRKKGTPIPTNDMWIAASAMQHGFGLASLDGHFARVDGLILASLQE
jgi:predicted nucleic acid-binding protein